jgi:type 1 glutamine amidotransferase
MNRILMCLVAVCLSTPAFATKDPYDRSGVPIEVQPTDPKAVKIVLIADAAKDHPPAEHEGFAGNALLAKMLQQTPNVATVMVQDGWPKNPETLQGARTVVFYMDGGGKQTTIAHVAEIQKLVDAGVGIVHLHQVIDYPTEPGKQAMAWLGGVYDAKSGSARGHWDESFSEFPEHEVTRGVEPFKLNDGWILKLKFVPEMKGITPILRTAQLAPKVKPDKPITGPENIVCWTYDRPDGGRSFVLTGAHNHKTWALPGLRRLVTNGILWSAKVEIPKGGAPIELDPDDLMTNLEPKPTKMVKPAVAKPAQ